MNHDFFSFQEEDVEELVPTEDTTSYPAIPCCRRQGEPGLSAQRSHRVAQFLQFIAAAILAIAQ